MRKLSITFIFGLLILALGIAFFGRTPWGISVGDRTARAWSIPAEFLGRISGAFRSFSEAVSGFRQLAGENASLKEQNRLLTVALATVQQEFADSDFLNDASDISGKSSRTPVLANIYSVSMAPAGYSASLNRGTRDGISTGAIAVSHDGVLVGTVADVFENSARILLVNDPRFSVTGKVMGAETAGIVRGNAGDDLIFDLIVQADEVHQGDTVVSSGDDLFPGGLIIGTVSHIQENDASVFKKVSIRPAANDIRFGRVLIIAP